MNMDIFPTEAHTDTRNWLLNRIDEYNPTNGDGHNPLVTRRY